MTGRTVAVTLAVSLTCLAAAAVVLFGWLCAVAEETR